MFRTIEISSTVSAQGVFVRELPDGNIAIRVDEKIYQGKPVTRLN